MQLIILGGCSFYDRGIVFMVLPYATIASGSVENLFPDIALNFIILLHVYIDVLGNTILRICVFVAIGKIPERFI